MAIHESPMVSKYDPFFAYKKAICPICSFLILVDYTFVLNLDKVDSVKH